MTPAEPASVPRTVVVTGATGAAGRAVCSVLATAGHRVIAVGTDAARLTSVVASDRCVANLTDPRQADGLAAGIREAHGPADGLVHLVGGWQAGSDRAGWDALEPRLLTTLRHATLAFRDDLSASPAGRLAIVSSTSTSAPTWRNANYATLKAAAEAWTAALAAGWRKAGTAAAVTFVVKALGDDATPVDALAEAIAGVWDQPAARLNGARISVLPPQPR